MMEKYYAAHIKTALDAVAINSCGARRTRTRTLNKKPLRTLRLNRKLRRRQRLCKIGERALS